MSNIDPTKPTEGQATTLSVRENFQAAATEIDANAAGIAANAGNISTNQTDIAQNKLDIAQNSSDIAQEVIDRTAGDANLQGQIDNLGGTVAVQDDGVQVTAEAAVLNFADRITAAETSPGVVKIDVDSVPGAAEVFINGVQQTFSGATEIDLPIPAGVKNLTVMVDGLRSAVSSNPLIVRIGDSAGVDNTGYQGVFAFIGAGGGQIGDGLVVSDFRTGLGADNGYHGKFDLALMDPATNKWSCLAAGSIEDASYYSGYQGTKSLAGELTTVRVTTQNGTAAITGGTINVLYDNPAVIAPAIGSSGKLLQEVKFQTGAFATGTATMPINTTPQITDGTEFLTASITPLSDLSRIEADVLINLSNEQLSAEYLIASVYRDGAEAFASGVQIHYDAAEINQLRVKGEIAAVSRASSTFTVRAGATATSETRMNGLTGQALGGTLLSSITLREIAP